MHFSVEIMFENVIWYWSHPAKAYLMCFPTGPCLCVYLPLRVRPGDSAPHLEGSPARQLHCWRKGVLVSCWLTSAQWPCPSPSVRVHEMETDTFYECLLRYFKFETKRKLLDTLRISFLWLCVFLINCFMYWDCVLSVIKVLLVASNVNRLYQLWGYGGCVTLELPGPWGTRNWILWDNQELFSLSGLSLPHLCLYLWLSGFEVTWSKLFLACQLYSSSFSIDWFALDPWACSPAWLPSSSGFWSSSVSVMSRF